MNQKNLSPLALDLVARLTAPPPDHPEFRGEAVEIDVTALEPEELGAIWRYVDRAERGQKGRNEATPFNNTAWRDNGPAYALAAAIIQDVRDSGHRPVFTDDQMLDYLDRTPDNRHGWQRGLQALCWRADDDRPLPETAVNEIRRILGPIEPTMHGAGYDGNIIWQGQSQADALVLAYSLHPEGTSPEAAAVAEVYRQTCPEGRYTRMELEWLLALSPSELQARHWSSKSRVRGVHPTRIVLDDQILADAKSHLESIQRGETAYEGYRAFSEADLSILERAFLRAQRRAEPSFAPLAHALLTLSCVPPDRKSKSVPSQTLCCKVAECISILPTPDGIASISEAVELTTNATVRRTMVTRLQQAKTALGLRPDVVLAMAASNPADKKQSALLAKLLQASYHTGLAFTLQEWREKLLDATGAHEFTRALIWQVGGSTAAGGGSSFMAAGDADTPGFTDAQGRAVEIPTTAQICLWHPLHSAVDERQAWRKCIRQLQIAQPFRQAFREHYVAPQHELDRPVDAGPTWAANRTERFAQMELSIKPLVGLARAEGWKIVEGGLDRSFGDVQVRFELGDTLRSDMVGHTESGALSFWRTVGNRQVRVPIAQVGAVLFSEACRAADLLVSTCGYAFRGDDSREPITAADAGIRLMNDGGAVLPPAAGPVHPQLRRERRLDSLAGVSQLDMLAMRRQVLEDCFAEHCASGKLVLSDRAAVMREFQVNLATAAVTKDGEQVEIKVPKIGSRGSKLAALPWMPHDEAMLEKLVGVIATLV